METAQLLGLLSRRYFEKLLVIITNRAELLATERQLVETSGSTQRAREELREKQRQVREVWAELKRGDLLRLKRSDLGRRMFSNWQGAISGKAFKVKECARV